MVEIRQLKVGDKVRIVDQWDKDGRCCQNDMGDMDCWLGSVMTVRNIYGDFCRMEEDRRERDGYIGWVWNKYCIAEVLPRSDSDNDETDETVIAEGDFMNILCKI